jgi:hypothetical protein
LLASQQTNLFHRDGTHPPQLNQTFFKINLCYSSQKAMYKAKLVLVTQPNGEKQFKLKNFRKLPIREEKKFKKCVENLRKKQEARLRTVKRKYERRCRILDIIRNALCI